MTEEYDNVVSLLSSVVVRTIQNGLIQSATRIAIAPSYKNKTTRSTMKNELMKTTGKQPRQHVDLSIESFSQS